FTRLPSSSAKSISHIIHAEKLRRSYHAEVKQARRTSAVAQLSAATNGRTFRRFLLMQQFEAAEIGARIKQAQRERGLLQHELAAMASFSQRSLQDYQSGVTIPYKHLSELSRLLGKPVEWFLRGDEAVNVEEERLREIVREEVAAALAPLLELLRDRLASDDPEDQRHDREHDQHRQQRLLADARGD